MPATSLTAELQRVEKTATKRPETRSGRIATTVVRVREGKPHR